MYLIAFFILIFYLSLLPPVIFSITIKESLKNHNFIEIIKDDIKEHQKRQNNDKNKWKFPILYQVIPPVNGKVVDRGLRFLMNLTCLKFKRVPKLKTTGLSYFRGNGCWSHVGKVFKGIPQPISIGNECELDWVIHHETMHALGFEHEVSRPDRNKYVTPLFENVQRDSFSNFIIEPSSITHKLRYDFGSVMHYNREAFSKNGKLTLIPKNHHYLKTMGQVVQANFKDIKLINFHYCNNVCKVKLRCLNEGYTDPKNCKKCRCPSFYTGTYCGKLKKSYRSCPPQNLTPTNRRKILIIRGGRKCYFKFTTLHKNKIKIILKDSNLPLRDVCEPNSGLEVKYLLNKGVSGARFCGKDKNKIIISNGNVVTMKYVAYHRNQFVKIIYKKI